MDHVTMRERIASKLKQFGGQAKKSFGRLTGNKSMQVDGNREILTGKAEEKYSIAKGEVREQVDDLTDKLKK